MESFIVTIVYQVICGDGSHTPQFDEQLRLVNAASREQAVAKAIRMGQQGQETFYNIKQRLVEWRFVNVTAVVPVDDDHDGAEVFSCIREVTCAAAYTNFIHEKATGLLR